MKKLLSTVAAILVACSAVQAHADFTEGFESGTFGPFSTLGSNSILDGGFGVPPKEGNFFAGINNGVNGLGGAFDDSVVELALGLPLGSLDGLIGDDAINGAAMTTSVFLNAGERAFFQANFLTNEDTPDPDYNDFSFFSVVDSSGNVESLSVIADTFSIFSNTSAFENGFGGYAEATGWFAVSFVAPTSDTYRIGFGVMNHGDTDVTSALLIDTIPEPSTLLPLGIVACIGLVRSRRRR